MNVNFVIVLRHLESRGGCTKIMKNKIIHLIFSAICIINCLFPPTVQGLHTGECVPTGRTFLLLSNPYIIGYSEFENGKKINAIAAIDTGYLFAAIFFIVFLWIFTYVLLNLRQEKS